MLPPASYWFIAWLTLYIWRWWRHVSSKRLFASSGLHVVSWKTGFFITTAVRTSNVKGALFNQSLNHVTSHKDNVCGLSIPLTPKLRSPECWNLTYILSETWGCCMCFFFLLHLFCLRAAVKAIYIYVSQMTPKKCSYKIVVLMCCVYSRWRPLT
jgi:hypothetical protein